MACGAACCSPPSAAEAGAVPQQPNDDCCGQSDAAPKASCPDACCGDESQSPQPAAALDDAACGDACCGGGPSQAVDDDDDDDDDDHDTRGCRDACCDDGDQSTKSAAAVADSCQDACCTGQGASSKAPPVKAPDSCGDSCCADEAVSQAKEGPSCRDACCADEQPAVSASGCQNPSCDTETPTMAEPRCCDGKPSPCCDASCLDRLADRECRGDSSEPAPHCLCGGLVFRVHADPLHDDSLALAPVSGCARGTEAKPCEDHIRSTRDKYAAKLQALGCLCRALLALGQESCCPPVQRSSVERKRCARRSSSSPSRKSADSCCAGGAAASCSANAVRPGSKGKARCSWPRPQPMHACAQGCCEEKTAGADTVTQVGPSAADVENGLSGTEHVVLSISGMTCTGCETKLTRTLAGLDAVTNLKTSLVLSRAEFDLDLGSGSVAGIIKHLERTTEFKCEKVSNQGSSIDVMTPCDADEFINRAWPRGVIEMNAVTKNTVNVAFDAKVVGARHLLEQGWGSPLTLAPPRADPSLDAGSRHVRHVGFMTILSAILTIPVLVMAWAPLRERDIAYGSASLALATLVQVVIAGPFYPKALKALVFSRVIEMDLIIVLSTTTAYIFSVVSFGYLVAGQPLSTGEFFETSTLLVTLIMVGRYVAALARQKAVESISIRSLQTTTATLVEKNAEGVSQDRTVDVRLLQYGDVFKVMPDSQIPTDGTVISGSSEVNESMVTGESRPVEKYTKSSVIAGSINGAGALIVKVDRLPGDNTISAIASMVDEAKLSKPKLQDLADRVASYFVPVVIVLTIITFVVWVAVGIAAQGKSGSDAVIQAITYAITVLIVSCPCAVGLAVPMVMVIASGVAAERGVIIKSAEALEKAYKTSHVVLDKTGTLTEGRLTVVREMFTGSKDKHRSTQSLLLALLDSNTHPVSAAVASHLRSSTSDLSPAPGVSEPRVLTGKGVEATAASGSVVLRAGNSRWLGLSDDRDVQASLAEGLTTVCFTVNGSLAAVLGLRDTLRADAAPTVAELRRRGVAVHIVSGDDDAAVRAVARRLAIPDARVRARCSPRDKQAYVQALLAPRPRSPPAVVLFCGDGTNDAVALAQATIGVHMARDACTVARAAADVVLVRPRLAGLLTLVAVSRKSVGRIAFNFAWSFVYNVLAVLLAGGAFSALRSSSSAGGEVRIPPAFAGLGELVSVLPVVLAGVVLRWERV